jgi:protein-S-isoprenylcysteine O-methyltransferase Ste14
VWRQDCDHRSCVDGYPVRAGHRRVGWMGRVFSASGVPSACRCDGRACRTGGGLSTGEKEDRSNRWVLLAFSVIALLMAFFSSYTDRVGFWTLDGDPTRWVGVVACFLGELLRIIPVYVLRNRFSGLVVIQPGHRLETHGIYSVIRNPSYLGMLVTSLGWVLTFRSGIGVLLVATLMVPLVARIRAEERLLREHFGVEYDAYCKRTWRLLPGLY